MSATILFLPRMPLYHYDPLPNMRGYRYLHTCILVRKILMRNQQNRKQKRDNVKRVQTQKGGGGKEDKVEVTGGICMKSLRFREHVNMISCEFKNYDITLQ